MANVEGTYYPEIFRQSTAEAAKLIILTPEAGLSPEERWEKETDFLAPYLQSLPPGPVLDYGCGIGRLSKVLTQTHHFVAGVDISPTMRHQADVYVDNPARFVALDPEPFRMAVQYGLEFSAGIAVWTLQHIPSVMMPIPVLSDALAENAPLLVVNRNHGAVPVVRDGKGVWLDEQYDLDGALLERFVLEYEEAMPESLCAPGAYLRVYRNRRTV